MGISVEVATSAWVVAGSGTVLKQAKSGKEQSTPDPNQT